MKLHATIRAALALLRAYLTVLLSVLGLLMLVVAGFTLCLTAGFVVSGVSLLVLAYYAEAEGQFT